MVGRGQTNRFLNRLAGVTSGGHKDVTGSIAMYLSGADRAFLNKTNHSLSNIFGRQPKPWVMGSLAFGALAGGTSMGQQMYQAAVAEPQPIGNQAPALMYDAIPNVPDDMNTMGLVQALHKNRHG